MNTSYWLNRHPRQRQFIYLFVVINLFRPAWGDSSSSRISTTEAANTVTTTLVTSSVKSTQVSATDTTTDTTESDTSSHTTTTIASSITSSITSSTTRASSITSSASSTYSVVAITGSNSNNVVSSKSSSRMPTLSSSSSSSTDLPIPTIIIPSNDNNPFMNTSSAPEGTVFIAVAAILGAIVIAIFLWNVGLAAYRRKVSNKFKTQYVVYQSLPTPENDKNGLSPTITANSTRANQSPSRGTRILSGYHKKRGSQSQNMINSGLFVSPTAQFINSAAPDNLNSLSSLTPNVGILGVSNASVYMPSNFPGGIKRSNSNRASRSNRHMSTNSMSSTTTPMSSNSGQSLLPSPIAGHSRNTSRTLAVSNANEPEPRTPSVYLDDLLSGEKK